MKDVTKLFNNFREASRHLGNTQYVPSENDLWNKRDAFFEVCVLLFQHQVCTPLDIEYDHAEWFCEPVSLFKLIPPGSKLPIMINRVPEVDHGYWDHEIVAVEPDEFDLTFIGYFDWDDEGVIDHKYIMCRITGAKSQASVVGHTALVESQYVAIHFDEAANKSKHTEL